MDKYVGIEYRVINAYAFSDCLISNLRWYGVVEEVNETQDAALDIIIPITELFIASLTTSSCDQKYNHCFNSQHLINNSVDAIQLSTHWSRIHLVVLEVQPCLVVRIVGIQNSGNSRSCSLNQPNVHCPTKKPSTLVKISTWLRVLTYITSQPGKSPGGIFKEICVIKHPHILRIHTSFSGS